MPTYKRGERRNLQAEQDFQNWCPAGRVRGPLIRTVSGSRRVEANGGKAKEASRAEVRGPTADALIEGPLR